MPTTPLAKMFPADPSSLSEVRKFVLARGEEDALPAHVADDLLVPQETAEHLARLRAENANHTAQEVQPHASQLR